MLYSNKVDEDDLIMTIKPREIVNFFEKRYNYLDVISKRINDLHDDYRVELKKKPIESNLVVLEQLKILKVAS